MAQSRNKVQQLGFFDPEVIQPTHDNLVLWAHARADDIFRVVHPELFDGTWRRDEIDPWIPCAGDRDKFVANAKHFAATTPRPSPRTDKRIIEYVLRRRTGHGGKYEQLVGYADLLVTTLLPRVTNVDDSETMGLSWGEGPRFLIEAKVELPTVGELMRQLQLYRTAFGGKLVVVSPDGRYADILADQGVVFVKYEPAPET